MISEPITRMPVAKATPVTGWRRPVSDHVLHGLELVSVLSGPRWVPCARLIFRGPMGVTWQRDYQPGRRD